MRVAMAEWLGTLKHPEGGRASHAGLGQPPRRSVPARGNGVLVMTWRIRAGIDPMLRRLHQPRQTALVPQAALGNPQAGDSAGQAALLQQAGPAVTNGIRAQVDADARMDQANNGFVDRLLFWRRTEPQGIVVDPQKEAQRLREDAALGQSPETGDTPIIQPRKKGWLEGLF